MNTYGHHPLWQVNGQQQMQDPGCSSWSTPAEREPPARPPEPRAFPAVCPSPEPRAFPAVCPSPWTSSGLPWGSAPQTQLMHFTAHSPFASANVLHCKRKAELEPAIPAKQLITEEKMAAHLNSLHISQEYMEHGAPVNQTYTAPPFNSTASEAQIDVNEWLKGGKKIVLADEIKRIQEEPLIPAALLERLEKPCMSLIVWKPKEDIVQPKEEEEDDDENKSPRNPSSVRRHRVGVLVSDVCEDTGMEVEM